MSASSRTSRLVLTGAAAAAVLLAPSVAQSQTAESDASYGARPCVNGVVPGNPYIVNCNLPPRGPQVRGSAPDAGAIIACRGWPGCLSWYVNRPYY